MITINTILEVIIQGYLIDKKYSSKYLYKFL